MIFLFFSLLIKSSESNSIHNPILIIPGLGRSRLSISSNNSLKKWYCPSKVQNVSVFINFNYMIPPRINCLLDWLTVQYDHKTDLPASKSDTVITAESFGSIDGVTGTGPSITKQSRLIAYFDILIERLQKLHGYDEIFSAPYDWRLGFAFPPNESIGNSNNNNLNNEFNKVINNKTNKRKNTNKNDFIGGGNDYNGENLYSYADENDENESDDVVIDEICSKNPNYFKQLKELVEKIYNKRKNKNKNKNNNYEDNKSDKNRVRLIGHSFGCYLIHVFLTEKVDSEWRKKYIENVVYVAPSFSGSGVILQSLWRKKLPKIEKLYDTKLVRKFVKNLASFHLHIPNQKIFENETIFILPNGTELKGNQTLDFLISQRKIDPLYLKPHIKYISSFVEDPDFKLNIIYNSQIDTKKGIKLEKIMNEDGKPIYGKGDGTILKDGIEYYCKKWTNNNNNVNCFDLKSKEWVFSHTKMLRTEKSVDLIIKMLMEEENFRVSDYEGKEL